MSKQRINIPEFKPEEIPLSCTWIVIGCPASGKCLGVSTKVMMFDRSIKNVEDIVPGDMLRGDDDLPRNVLSTTKGKDEMYEIVQSLSLIHISEPTRPY